MNIQTIFQRLGLPKHAFLVYQVLKKRGLLSPTAIGEAAGMHRPAVYRALESLLKRGIIRAVQKRKRNLYQAGSPTRIAEEFVKEAEKATSLLARFFPISQEDGMHARENILLLHGRKGVEETFDDVIEHTPRGETFYRFTSEKDLDSVNSYLSPHYRKFRDKKNLERLVISNSSSGSLKRPRLERFIKYIPSERELFNQNIIQLVYGDRIALIDLNTEDAIIIENSPLAEFQKVIFRELYRRLEA